MEMQDLKQLLIALMDEVVSHKLAEFKLETDGLRIYMKTHGSNAMVQPVIQPVETVSVSQTAETTTATDLPAGTRVEAPLVGIFYSASSPNDPPFIEVGQKVAKGDTLFIIEAMKTMNEIASPCDGTVSRIFAQSGDMVEYKQLLVIIE